MDRALPPVLSRGPRRPQWGNYQVGSSILPRMGREARSGTPAGRYGIAKIGRGKRKSHQATRKMAWWLRRGHGPERTEPCNGFHREVRHTRCEAGAKARRPVPSPKAKTVQGQDCRMAEAAHWLNRGCRSPKMCGDYSHRLFGNDQRIVRISCGEDAVNACGETPGVVQRSKRAGRVIPSGSKLFILYGDPATNRGSQPTPGYGWAAAACEPPWPRSGECARASP